jgi:hypothetical protein
VTVQSNKGRMTVAERLIQQGREKAQRKTLRQLLTLKFGTIAPSVARVANAESAALDEWTLRVLTASSAEDVVA